MENTTKETVKFGFRQLRERTPEIARWAFRIFFYCTSSIVLFITVFTEISTETKELLLKGTTFGNLAAHALSKMFGVKEEPTDFYNK